ncbi:MAG: hypothetical protein RL719_64 [Actinomycetota bacterium]
MALAAVILPLFNTDAASAATFTPSVVNTGQYREGTDPAAKLFDPLVINRIDLTVPQPTMDYLNSHTSGDYPGSHGDYQPASMTFTTTGPGGTTTPSMQVGLRLKGGWGSGNRNMDGKPAFKVKINYSVKGQKLYGLKKLTLNNMVQDRSMLHEAVGYRLFRAVGVPASRTGYVRVFVNGVDHGLHLNLETYDSVSLGKRFMTTKHLYEGAYWQDIIPGQAQAMQVDEGDPLDKADITALANVNNIDASQSSQVNQWFTEVQKYADIREMIHQWAVERYIADWDGYSWQIKNNYYVHFDAQGIASILPSGIDQTSTGGLSMIDATSSGQMFVNCMASIPCRSYYYGAVNKVRATAATLNLPKMIDDISSVIGNDVISDPRREYGDWEWNWAVIDAKNFHTYRASAVDSETNTNTPSDVKVSYNYDDWAVGSTFSPTTTKTGPANPFYTVINGTQNCSVNSGTGVVTAKAIGWCRVSAKVPSTTGYSASLSYFTFLVGSIEGALDATALGTLEYGQTKTITVDAATAATPLITATGPCTVSDTEVTATSGTGVCKVTVWAPSDGIYKATSLVQNVKLIKSTERTYAISKTAGFTNTTLPQGGEITLTRAPYKVAGVCSVSGLKLKALAAKGKCTVSFAKWSDSNHNYSALSKSLTMISGTQTLPSTVTAGGTRGYYGSFVLATGTNILTSWGQPVSFTTNANCQVVAESDGNTYAYSLSSGQCKVTLSVPKRFGLKALTRTWVLDYKG